MFGLFNTQKDEESIPEWYSQLQESQERWFSFLEKLEAKMEEFAIAAIPELKEILQSDDDIYKLELINESSILFRNTTTNKVYNLLEAKSCWWRRNGISRNTFTNYKRENLIYSNQDLSSLLILLYLLSAYFC